MIIFQKRREFFYTIIFSVICSCNTELKSYESRSIELATCNNCNQLTIVNSGDELAHFTLIKPDYSINELEDIESVVCSMSPEYPEEALERKAWRFVIDRFDYSIPLCFQGWAQTPLVMLNSLGSGYSGDHALLLYHVWRLLGYEARLWQLNGHDVAEVKKDGKWKMYDPTYEIYYLNNKGEVAGVKELIEHPNLITIPHLNILPIVPNDLRDVYNFAYRHSESLARIYTTTGDNVKSTWIRDQSKIKSTYFELPPKATLTLPTRNNRALIIWNDYGLRNKFDNTFEVSLKEEWVGEFSMPFYMSNISGEGRVLVNEEAYDVRNEVISFYPKESTDFPQKISIEQSTGSLIFHYLYHAKDLNLNDVKTIELKGSDISDLEFTSKLLEMDTLVHDTLDVMSEHIKDKANFLILYEKNKELFMNRMFNSTRPLQSLQDVEENVHLFLYSNEKDSLENLQLIEQLTVSFTNIQQNLEEEKIKGLYKILSDQRMFVAMLQVAVFKSPEFMEQFIIGLLNHS